jgi:hypothetical protein
MGPDAGLSGHELHGQEDSRLICDHDLAHRLSACKTRINGAKRLYNVLGDSVMVWGIIYIQTSHLEVSMG